MKASQLVRASTLDIGPRSFSVAVCLTLALVSTGCKQGRLIKTPVSTPDGSAPDAGSDGHAPDGPCGSPTDAKNCGTCGHDCTTLTNVRPGAAGVECRAGACFVPGAACAVGFGHCTTRADDVCETNLADAQNCGACGTKCPLSAPLCAVGATGPACSAACAGAATDI